MPQMLQAKTPRVRIATRTFSTRSKVKVKRGFFLEAAGGISVAVTKSSAVVAPLATGDDSSIVPLG